MKKIKQNYALVRVMFCILVWKGLVGDSIKCTIE